MPRRLRLLEGTDAPIERAHLSQERGRLAFRMGDHARAAKWADEALGYARDAVRPDRGRGDRARSGAGDCGGAQHQGCRPRAARAQRRGGARGRAQRRGGRSGRPAERGLPRPTPISACSIRWSIRRAPSRSAGAASRSQRRIGDLGFQARLYTNLAVACCTFTDRCGEEGVPAAEKAIEIDRALDQREHLAGAADRARPDPPVPRRAGPRAPLLPRGARGGARDRRAAAAVSLL